MSAEPMKCQRDEQSAIRCPLMDWAIRYRPSLGSSDRRCPGNAREPRHSITRAPCREVPAGFLRIADDIPIVC